MIQRIKIEAVEDKQLPRWVYAMMKANQDPNAEFGDNADVKVRMAAQLKAQDFFKLRQARMKEMKEQQGTSSRTSGLEWKSRPKNKFTEEELKKVLPMTDFSYIAKKTFFLTIVGSLLLSALGIVVFGGMAVCAELKLCSDYHHFSHDLAAAWDMLRLDPTAYVHRVMTTLRGQL